MRHVCMVKQNSAKLNPQNREMTKRSVVLKLHEQRKDEKVDSVKQTEHFLLKEFLINAVGSL